jgi:hypothetical protein
MLFISHFSFDEIDAEVASRHGYFSSIVDAENLEAAVAKFEDHIRTMKGTLKEMRNMGGDYIEEMLRVAKVPETPMITRIQSSQGEFSPSVSHAMPGVESEDVDAFGYRPDVEKHETPGGEAFTESEPFIKFAR